MKELGLRFRKANLAEVTNIYSWRLRYKLGEKMFPLIRKAWRTHLLLNIYIFFIFCTKT